MKRQFAIILIALSFIGILAGIWKVRSDTREKKSIIAQAEVAELKKTMLGAYHLRAALIRTWAVNETDPELNALLIETESLPLESPAEFQRFDWVQEQLNVKITNLLNAFAGSAKRKPKDWEGVEKLVAESREEFIKSAQKLNQSGILEKPVPTFPLLQN